mgnify:CR=1 FL=1
MADFGGDIDAFRNEARGWIEANFPASLKGKPNPMAREERGSEPSPDQEAWRKAMGEKGWGVPTWPAAYGGGGLTPNQARVLREEMARHSELHRAALDNLLAIERDYLALPDEQRAAWRLPYLTLRRGILGEQAWLAWADEVQQTLMESA